MFPADDAFERLCYAAEISLLETYRRWCHLLRFSHRREAGNMEPLTRDDAGMTRMGDRWLLILVRSNLKKFFERGFQKARFWTLDDESRAEKISRRRCQFAQFFPCRGEGCLAKCAAWVSPRQKNLLRCFQNRWFSPFIGDEFPLIIRWHRQRSAPWQPGPRFQICPNREDFPLRKGAPKGPAVSQTRFLARGSSDN